MSHVHDAEQMAATALYSQEWDDIFAAAEDLGEALEVAGIGRITFASDLSTSVEIDGKDYSVDWFGRLGPRLTEMTR